MPRPRRDARTSRGPVDRGVPLPTRIVVGTDGTRESMGALRMAAALELAASTRVSVVSAVAPAIVPVLPALDMRPLAGVEAARRRMAMIQLRRQVNAVRPKRRWSVSTAIGWPAEIILSLARDVRADMIVVGIGRHRPIDRLLAHETAIAIARRATVPLFAAAPRALALPKHAVAAVDFTPESVHAARLAAQLVGPEGVVTLVHVSPFHTTAERAATWTEVLTPARASI